MLRYHRKYRSSPDYKQYFPAEPRTPSAADCPYQWWSWRDYRVYIHRLSDPAAPVKAILLHGGAGHGRMLIPYAALFDPGMVEAVIPDLPGYGLTQPGDKPVDYQDWIDCIVDLAAYEHDTDGRPIVLFGISMGGMLGYTAAARSPTGRISAVVATSLLDPTDPQARAAVSRCPKLGRRLSGVMNRTRLLDSCRVPVRWLTDINRITNNPDLNLAIRRDPMGGGNSVSWRFLRSYQASAPEVAQGQFSIPLLVLAHPACDRLTPVGLSKTFFDRLTCDKHYFTLDGAGHIPVEQVGLSRLQATMRTILTDIASRTDHFSAEVE
ncbi:MAG: alpha/beta fold hydrolase [Pseudonocardiaceae bacterium]